MKIRYVVVSSLFVLACGGGSSKPTTTPEPAMAPAGDPSAAAPAPVEPPPEAKKAEPAPPPPPPPPRLALGDGKITWKAKTKKGAMDGEIALAADGTLTATMNQTVGKKKDTKTKSGKITADGEMSDDKGEVIAKVADDGTVSVRMQDETRENGKVVKSESKMEDVGSLAADGSFTNKKDGAKLTIDDKGTVTGLPADMGTITITGDKKSGMFVLVAMLGASKSVSDVSTSAPTAVPAKKK